MSTSARRLGAAVVAAAALVLGGCTAGVASSQSDSGATTPPVGPSSVDTSPPPSTPSPVVPTTAASVPTSSTAPAPTSPGASASPDALRSSVCTSSVLSASLADGGAAAGSMLPDLVLTNTGDLRCTLQGWPGVSFVGGGNGTQIGAAGELDRSSPHGTVTLDPGKSAHAPLRIAQALNYPKDTCQPVTADGLRVYPPGETHALFVPSGLTACRSSSVKLITVQALLPGA